MADISGAWTVHLTFILGEATHAAVIVQTGNTLSGTYRGVVTTGEITGSVDGDRVIFSTTLRYETTRIPMTFTGTIQGDTMSGEVDQGEYWKAQWRATRRTAP